MKPYRDAYFQGTTNGMPLGEVFNNRRNFPVAHKSAVGLKGYPAELPELKWVKATEGVTVTSGIR